MAYYAGNPLNRLSYLRSHRAVMASALTSDKSRFLVYDNLNPLLAQVDRKGTKQLIWLKWKDVKKYIAGDAKSEDLFVGIDGKNDELLGTILPASAQIDQHLKGKDVKTLTTEEKRHFFINQPALVFLGVDERSAPESEKSLPVSKPTEESTLESHSPYGVPHWAFDVSSLTDFKSSLLKKHDMSKFTDIRSEMQNLAAEPASIAGEGRALLDWNRRNLFCPACSRPLRSVWAGWKRACVPGESTGEGADSPPACISKKGVHNFSYPRTDPVVIMAITTPDRDQLLLGRQKAWPRLFYSALAGFIESGETIEEAVRREVYEEAGIEVGDVFYHSSQPWPYPSSLMIGAIGIAKPGQTIRCDLDNELEDARWFTREQVLEVINSTAPHQISRVDIERMEGNRSPERPKSPKQGELFRMPPATAIANTLVHAWANGSYFGASGPPPKL